MSWKRIGRLVGYLTWAVACYLSGHVSGMRSVLGVAQEIADDSNASLRAAESELNACRDRRALRVRPRRIPS